MMKILWITNIPVQLNDDFTRCGWLQGALQGLLDESGIQVADAYPGVKKIEKGKISYYVFPKVKKNNLYPTEAVISKIIGEYNPDIIHIWGTEYPHALAAVNAAERAGKLENAVISIQGLVSEYAKVYYAGVPMRYRIGASLKELYKKQSIIKGKHDFEKRGKSEIQALQKAPNVIGRTEWDKACTEQINPNRKYYFCNEVLRQPFYEMSKWDATKIEQHSIFVSQAGYPIKGLHQLLKAAYILQRRYEDLKIYVAGPDKFCNKTPHKGLYAKLPPRIRRDSYENYLFKMAKKYNLLDKIVFLDEINANEMKKRYLKSHVFVSPSIIENSPNSVSEAKILGVPCISSYVGGVPDRLIHGEDGFLYPWNEPDMLAYYIQYIFEHSEEAAELSKNAVKNEEIMCDRIINTNRLKEIYEMIECEK